MKKRIMTLLLGGAMVLSLCACGRSENKGTEAVGPTETTESGAKAARTQLPATPSAEMKIDFGKQVKKLCDYKKVPVTITGNYEVKEADMEQIIMSDLSACYADLEEVKDRKTIGKDDVAKVDYTGSIDGKEFDGGKAENAYVTMGDGNGYIDGFTKDLVGAKVGDDVSTDVTFPDPYAGNADLSGKKATFKFKVKGIFKKITNYKTLKKMAKDKNSLVNTNIAATFASYGITDLDSLIKYETSYVEKSMKNKKYSDTVAAIKEYMLKNCEVEVPEDYLDARVTEYQVSFENDNLSENQNLEEFLKSQYNTSLEDAKKTWKENVENQIKTEFIFGLIAGKENVKLDEKEFESFIQNIVQQSSASTSATAKKFASEDEVYKYYGADNVENGKKYMKQLFVMNKAIDKVYDTAKVTVEKPKETESTEKAASTEK